MEQRTNYLVVFLGILSLPIVSFFWSTPLTVLLVLSAIGLSMLKLRSRREDVFLFMSTSASGAVAEAVAIYFGAWEYATPHFAGVPYWLPVLWGIAAIFIVAKQEIIEETLNL